MRKTFLRSGFLKEARYREGWPVTGSPPLASVAYAILRRDWETGETTNFVGMTSTTEGESVPIRVRPLTRPMAV